MIAPAGAVIRHARVTSASPYHGRRSAPARFHLALAPAVTTPRRAAAVVARVDRYEEAARWLKLSAGVRVEWQGRAHFLAVAARAMRQVLVDHARRRHAGKRGANPVHVSLSHAGARDAIPPEDLLALDAALDRLAERDLRLRQVVEYRFFGGLTEREIAEVLGVTERTVQRDWVRARAWLHQEIYPGAGPV